METRKSSKLKDFTLINDTMLGKIFTITIDNGYKLKLWFKQFIKKILLVYAIYITIYIFIVIYQYLIRVYIHFDNYEFRILHLFFIIGGNILLIISPKIFSMLFKEKSLIKQDIRKIKLGEMYENNA